MSYNQQMKETFDFLESQGADLDKFRRYLNFREWQKEFEEFKKEFDSDSDMKAGDEELDVGRWLEICHNMDCEDTKDMLSDKWAEVGSLFEEFDPSEKITIQVYALREVIVPRDDYKLDDGALDLEHVSEMVIDCLRDSHFQWDRTTVLAEDGETRLYDSE